MPTYPNSSFFEDDLWRLDCLPVVVCSNAEHTRARVTELSDEIWSAQCTPRLLEVDLCRRWLPGSKASFLYHVPKELHQCCRCGSCLTHDEHEVHWECRPNIRNPFAAGAFNVPNQRLHLTGLSIRFAEHDFLRKLSAKSKACLIRFVVPN
jgi:hypothetical protein